ncbi:leucine-rich repeat flightless-interacting protein 1 isoform X45 [Ovis canadensis]|uniref:leucine-rich repeat flightless-interacting protein 1 isoform X45 n=1 Tax=Ovis canadensis TaxID=37174 RepID=UPI0038B465E2
MGTEGGCLVINVRAGGSSVGAEQARWTRRAERAERAERRGGARRRGGPVSSAPRAAPRPGPPAPATCTPPLRPRPSPGTAEARSARARARARLPSRGAPRSRCSRHAAALSPPADPGSPTSTEDLCWLCEKVAFSRQDDQPCGRAEPGDRLPEPRSSETGGGQVGGKACGSRGGPRDQDEGAGAAAEGGKKYYGLDTKWGDIEQWMEDSERYSHRSRRNTSASDEDERMSVGSRGSLRVEERPEKDFTEKGSRSLPGLSAATLASLGGTSSRRGSGDTSISIDTEASIREIKDSLAEVEEKYKKAMVSNAQLDNEKTNFMYQVDTLKDMLLELEEQLAESRRQYEEKSKEFEREKHAHSILQFQFAEVKEALKQREEMLEKHGIILNSEIATNGETPDTLNSIASQGSTKMTKEELSALKATGDGALDIRLKKLVDERECLLEQIKKLKGQLEERQKNIRLDTLHPEDGDANRQISDLKFKLAKSEQEITALEQNVIRLESQVSRYKQAAENAEKIEDELKAEKRKLQRELRSALDKTEELEVSNGHLVKRLEKMKANRSVLLSQQ